MAMSTPPGNDLSDLIKWTARDEWRDRLDEVMAEHFEPAMQEFGLKFHEIDDALGSGSATTLWGCAFEGFLTRRFEADGENPVEAYLRRRGWKERAATRSYIAALQTSVMSLYEVSDLVAGESFHARDLIRGGEPVLVSERTATRTLKPWDRIAARIVCQGPKMILTGGLLAFTLEASQSLFAQLRDQCAHVVKGSRSAALSLDALEGWTGSDEDLRRAAPLFTRAWLFDVLSRALGMSRPTLLNSEGDEVVFHTVAFPLASGGSHEEIAHRLGDLPSLRQETPAFWNWIDQASSRPAKSRDTETVMWNVTMDDGAVVLGNVELKERTLSLSVNSAARAERGKALLAAQLTNLVGPPLTEIQTVEQMQAAPRARDEQPAARISLEMQTKLVHAMLDRQYRALLDEPIPMLGDMSPRAAARSARGRRNVAAWLKYIENRSRNAPDQSDPMATYDLTWLWRDLGVEQLRR
jgi:hypothetical protein